MKSPCISAAFSPLHTPHNSIFKIQNSIKVRGALTAACYQLTAHLNSKFKIRNSKLTIDPEGGKLKYILTVT